MKYMLLYFIILIIPLFLMKDILFKNLSFRENYQSLTDCLNQGYPKDFCIQTPIQAVISDSYCNCANGQLGTYKHRNQCYCYPFDPQQPYFTEKVFNDYLD